MRWCLCSLSINVACELLTLSLPNIPPFFFRDRCCFEEWLEKWGKAEQALSVDCSQSGIHHFHSVLCLFNISNSRINDTAIELHFTLLKLPEESGTREALSLSL
uniref:Secreted protein n=1 Tax=Cucumis sativus TaxID=3659 RepID=A0A0A0LQ51_CUCSA